MAFGDVIGMPPSEQDLREHYGLHRDPDRAFWTIIRAALLSMADAIKARYL